MSTTAQSPTWRPKTLKDTSRFTYSPESEAGPSHSVGQDGQTTDRYGPEAVPVSRFRALGSEKELPTPAISGPLFTASSPSAALQSALGSKLRAILDGSGSPLYALTWSTWAMPAQGPIFRLRASARRTKGKGFSGWATPTQRDHKSESASSEFNQERDKHKRGKPLSYQVLGILSTGFHMPMATPSQLNPDFTRWLMGFPEEWDDCAPTEMPSSRK